MGVGDVGWGMGERKKRKEMFLKRKSWRDLQDGIGLRRGDHLPSDKYIRNTPTCGTTPTEHLLNAGRRPQTSKRQETPHVPG